MSSLKLSYFDFPGGRGEPVRMALSIGNIDYQDLRISFAEFSEMRASTPLNAVPILQIDDVVYTQCNAMLRYAGRQAGLYPEDPWQAFLCDEIIESLEDASNATVRTFGLEGDEFKIAREQLANTTFTRHLNHLAQRLEAAGGRYFADQRLTIADLKAYVWLRSLRSGNLDHIPTDLIDRVAPQLLDYIKHIAAEPAVATYLTNQ